jgi:hypothetical protein
MKTTVAALAALLLAGCAPAGPTVDPVAVTVTAVQVGAGALEISGTATVPDGALIYYDVTQVLPGDDIPVRGTSGDTPVKGGQYRVVVAADDAAEWDELRPGPADVWVAFQTIGQPDEVTALYGDEGQQITGDVSEAGNLRRVEATTSVDLR